MKQEYPNAVNPVEKAASLEELYQEFLKESTEMKKLMDGYFKADDGKADDEDLDDEDSGEDDEYFAKVEEAQNHLLDLVDQLTRYEEKHPVMDLAYEFVSEFTEGTRMQIAMLFNSAEAGEQIVASGEDPSWQESVDWFKEEKAKAEAKLARLSSYKEHLEKYLTKAR